ncbi:hypothetical protein FQN50_009466 [Emmonsiellopsis sp. PD_5]|nr:hypothetical protein FQN50_009466 [Emmonsiellopsis sp. PD_5]
MARYDHGSSGDTPVWPLKDIIYIAIIGPVMLAAFVEWFLWLSAFLYCLYKVFVKADHWSVKVLAVVMMVLFTAFRGTFLPVMVVTLPLPSSITRHFPPVAVSFLQWFAFWTFAILLIVPWLFCIYRLVTNSLGRTKRIKEVLDERTAPKTVIVMPVYKEEPEVLIKAVDSVVDCDYPASCIHVFLSYDGGLVDESYLKVADHLGIPITLKSYPESIDVTYKGARITISRFKHGGKRHCQKQTFKLIDKVYARYLQRHDNLFVLFIDSDCILDRVCLQNFMYDMELRPGSKRNMLAMTGVITSTTQKNTLITLLQDMEYIHGQLFERSVESGCGSVTCLPGALTMLRFSAFRKMAKYYFADKAEQCEDLFDFGKCHLGEDRWLTHLFMIGAKERYQIQMCTSAFCKTEAVQTFRSLLKQRRRWFLGFITNEVCMLTDIRLWFRYPMLCLVRFMQNTIRTTALLFFIMVISIITTSNKVQNLPVGFIAVSLGLNYLLMLYFGAKLRRYKAWLYPLMFLLNPFFNWLYMVYGIFTAGQRTWGGPRADAAAADEHTTPEEAAVQAKATGDELNVNLDTFRSAAEGKETVPVHPAEGIEGRFAAPDLQPNGYYYNDHDNDSTATFPDFLPRNPGVPPLPLHPRDSFDSVMTTDSVQLPRRLESIMGDEDQRKLQLARRSRACSSVGVDLGDLDGSRESLSDGGRRSRRGGDSPARSTRSEGVFPYDTYGGLVPPDAAVFEPPRSRTGRSPLGRNSPVRAPEDDGTDSPPEASGGVEPGSSHQKQQDDEALEQGKKKKKRRRLTKRSRDPGDMV